MIAYPIDATNMDHRVRIPTKRSMFRALNEIPIPIETILDVGVQYGTPELMDCYPDRPHVLFEPIEEYYPSIRSQYGNRGLSFVLAEVALSDQSGLATLEISSVNAGQSVTHARFVDSKSEGRAHRDVRTITLDGYLESHASTAPYLLKIDVDGAEARILRGATQTLQKTNLVVIEAQSHNMIERARILEASGFELFDIVDICYYDDRMVQFDMAFVNTAMLKARNLHVYRHGFDIAKWKEYRPE